MGDSVTRYGSFLGWIASFALTVLAIAKGQTIGAFFLLPTRAWELLTGAIVAAGILPKVRHAWAAGVIAGVGFACILGSMVGLHEGARDLSVLLLIPALGAACIIYAGESAPNPVAQFLSLRPMVFTGRASYSLYLWHWPALVFARYVLIVPMTTLQTVATLLAVAIVGILSWRFVEQPLRRKDRVFSKRLVFGGFAAFNCAFLALGLWACKTGGLPQRFDPKVLVYTHADKGMPEQVGNFHTGERIALGDALAEPPTILLWGDSHANSIAPAIDDLAKAHHRSVVMLKKAGCLPATDMTVPQTGYCLDFDKAVATVLHDHPEIKTVVLDARWSAYLRWWSAAEPGTSPDVFKARFRQALVSLTHDLRGQGRTVIIVAEPPPRGLLRAVCSGPAGAL